MLLAIFNYFSTKKIVLRNERVKGLSVVLSQTHVVYIVCTRNSSVIEKSFGPDGHKMCAAPNKGHLARIGTNAGKLLTFRCGSLTTNRKIWVLVHTLLLLSVSDVSLESEQIF